MKLTLLFLFLSLRLAAQKIETIVPRQPVVTGTAFLVQYIITEPSSLINFSNPAFDSLHVVSGPNHYKGNSTIDGRLQPIENITYTVVALKTGAIQIPGLTANFRNGVRFTSNVEIVSVTTPPPVSYLSSSAYTDISLYAPTSKTDLDKLIDDNIFVTTEVNKKAVFIGEPVVATFTLYSRLQANSGVSNTPSLYGFQAIDMLDINRSYQAIKTIGNKIFNTSVIRKLQLYPEQAGKLLVDEMELRNVIEFDDPLQADNRKEVEKLLLSKPITITVKDLPGEKPIHFSGAVGTFSIDARLDKNRIAANQQGKLILTIVGKGNFIQFAPPVVQWPKEFDVFDPETIENLNKTLSPIEGSKEYIFNFVNDSVGNYVLPPISFSFFDPNSRNFKTIHTDSLKLEIIPGRAVQSADELKKQTRRNWVLVSLIILTILMVVFFLLMRQRKRTKLRTTANLKRQPEHIEQLIQLDLAKLSDKQACLELQKIIRKVHHDHSLTTKQKNELDAIENDCQLLAYADIDEAYKKEELKLRLIRLLQSL